MKIKIPSVLYTIRFVIFASLLSCLIWMNNVVSSVIFLVAVAFNICDFVISSKYGADKYGRINELLLMVFDRLIVLLPLVFATICGVIEVWVMLLLVVFEIATSMYRYYDETIGIKKRVSSAIYIIYNLLLYVSSILFLYGEFKLETYFIFSSSVVGAIFIVYSAVNFTSDNQPIAQEKEDKNENVIKEVTSVPDEIVE